MRVFLFACTVAAAVLVPVVGAVVVVGVVGAVVGIVVVGYSCVCVCVCVRVCVLCNPLLLVATACWYLVREVIQYV